ncbi:MAG: phosphotransferase [Firmicutes bacterium]|nr:phosphotransferase [Bacillota bacterium]
MDKRPVPSWLKDIWDELTKPPALLGNQPSHPRKRRPVQPDADEDEDSSDTEDEESDAPLRVTRTPTKGQSRSGRGFSIHDLFDSPTDPPPAPRVPQASSGTAKRVAQKYFVAKKTQRKPSTKPRPRTRPRRKQSSSAPTRTLTASTGLSQGSHTRSITIPPALRSSAATAQPLSALPAPLQAAAEQVRETLDCRIVETEIVDTVWRVTTDRGQVYALKETALSPARLRFIADALDEVYGLGFTHVARMIRRRSGDPYLQEAGQRYTLSEWLPGHRAQFASTRQVGAAARATARFHDVSRRFTPKGQEPPSAFAVFDHLLARKQDLVHVQNQLEQASALDDFDELALRQLPKANQQAADALALLKLPETERDLSIAVQDPGLCHLDVTRRNIILHPTGYAQLIDFDRTAFGPRTLDLAHLIRRAMQAHGTWTSEIAIAPLLAYNRVRPLTQGEYLLLEALLVFPHRLWRLLRTHYDGPEESEAQARKTVDAFRDAIALEDERERFLVTFARQVTRRERS